MISYDFVPISSQKGVLFFETPGMYIYIYIYTYIYVCIYICVYTVSSVSVSCIVSLVLHVCFLR